MLLYLLLAAEVLLGITNVCVRADSIWSVFTIHDYVRKDDVLRRMLP